METEKPTESSTGNIGSVVDIFCGVGGLSHGLKLEGFQIAAGIDLDEDCRYAYETNNNARFVLKDVSKIAPEEIDALYPDDGPKILVGCAPCQPFSKYNQKNTDPKWRLIEKFSDLIIAVQPDVVSMENVPSLVDFQGGQVFKSFLRKLEKENYKVVWDILYGPDYGLAQSRSRLVL
ncbi:MAG: DNA (cytosine-5-)-methyltransferase, partial [Rhodobacteraceae bacterium]|nr:DNA (cytosine-5-)-methyltransferase [Paracoccaceae bacterium]